MDPGPSRSGSGAKRQPILGVMHKILLREGQIDQEKEHFWMVGLDVSRRPLFIELVAIGGSYHANIKPAEAHFG
uniref:Uncharacterized protein n=1 Tax=Candidatus Kentrum sp. LFY TaxID=2126342 RepID=A0A450V4C0_9GAMM|nr:MAG: hypothetical protein BECKLFY1418A_GA0070994_11034 [Candidatus Kentron sp. LFY]